MRKLAASALIATGAATFVPASPANAVAVCDPIVPNGVCVYVLDDREFCPGGYRQVVRVDNPVDGTVLLSCVLN